VLLVLMPLFFCGGFLLTLVRLRPAMP
jgi:hypothetical protein